MELHLPQDLMFSDVPHTTHDTTAETEASAATCISSLGFSPSSSEGITGLKNNRVVFVLAITAGRTMSANLSVRLTITTFHEMLVRIVVPTTTTKLTTTCETSETSTTTETMLPKLDR